MPTHVFISEIDMINKSIKHLSHNLTTGITELEEQWKHETTQIRREMNDEVKNIKTQHKQDILNVKTRISKQGGCCETRIYARNY